MPEWSNGAVSKTVVRLGWDRGFESLSLRQSNTETIRENEWFLIFRLSKRNYVSESRRSEN